MEWDKRPERGHGLVDRLGTAALIMLAIAALSAAISFVVMLRQAKLADDREHLRGQQQAEELRRADNQSVTLPP